VLERFIPSRFRDEYARFATFAPVLLIVLIVAGGRFIAVPASWANQQMQQLVYQVASAGSR
jgi:hypothetical protein